jgi:hypothetical protein
MDHYEILNNFRDIFREDARDNVTNETRNSKMFSLGIHNYSR